MIFKAFRIGQRKSGSLWVSQSRVFFFCFRECCKLVQFCIPRGSNWFGPQWRNFCRGSWWLGSSWVNLSAGPSILQSRMHYSLFKWCKWWEERVKSKAGLYIADYLPPSHVWPLVSFMNCHFQQVGIWFQMEVPCNWPCQQLRAKATKLKQNILSPRNEPSTDLKIAKQNQSLLPSGRSICISALLKLFSLYLLPQGAAEPFLPLPTLYRTEIQITEDSECGNHKVYCLLRYLQLVE